jgi:autotransporter-associated beta strand protein
VLNIQNATALGGTAAGTTVSSGVLQIQGGISVAGESLSTAGTIRNISGTNEWSGPVNFTLTGSVAANGVGPLTNIAIDAGNLIIRGAVALPVGPTGTGGGIVINGNGNGEISGNITGGNAGVLALARNATGAGTWTLSGSNTYLGLTAINTYEVIAAGGFAIPDTSLTYLMSSGLLTLQANETIGSLTSNSGSSSINLNANTLSIGADNLNPVDPNGQTAFQGSIIGTGGIAKVGTGLLALTGSSSFSGGSTLSAGTLRVSNTAALGTGSLAVNGGTLDLRSSLSVGTLSGTGGTITGGTTGSFTLTTTMSSGGTFSGTIANGSATAVLLTKAGSGTLALSSANTYSGATSITGGVLNIQNATALGGTSAGTTVSSGAALELQGGVTVFGESLSLAGSGDSGIRGALRSISGTNTWTGGMSITLTAAVSAGVGGLTRIQSDTSSRLVISGPVSIAAGTFDGTAGTAAGLLLQSNGSGEISGNITGGVAGAMTFARGANNGSGTWTLSGSNSYLGYTAINNNPLVAAGGFAIPDTSLVYFLGAGSLTLQASETIGSLTSDATTASINLNSHTLTIGADNVTPVAPGGATTYLGSIIGTGGIVKVGTGRLTFSGSTAYSGSTIVKGGTLALGLNGSLGSSPTITVGDAGSSGAVLDILAKTGTFAFTSSQTVGGIGTIRMDAGDTARFAGIFAPGNSAGIFTFDGGTALLSGTTQIEILGAARGTGYDAVDLINSATLNYSSGVLALDFGSWLADQQSYQLFGSGSSSLLGGFSSVTVAGSNYTGLTFTGSNGVWTSQGTSPANQTLTFTEATGTLVIVPEPAAIALAGVGIAAAAWARRRSRGPLSP